MTIKKETGESRQFSTGAYKQSAKGKGAPVLFPPDAYLEVCKHFEEGAELHGDRNWEKGLPLSELMNSLERHIQQEKMGLTDEHHTRALAWNAIVYLATKLRIEAGILPKKLADIPPLKPVKKEYDLSELIEYLSKENIEINPLSKVKYPICPINMYWEGDEEKGLCDILKCDWDSEARGCTEMCKIDKETVNCEFCSYRRYYDSWCTKHDKKTFIDQLSCKDWTHRKIGD